MTFVTIEEAIKNKKGDLIFFVDRFGDLKSGTKDGKDWTMKKATIKDNSMEFEIALFNDEIKKLEPGKFYKLENPFWKEYEGKPQLSLGNYYKLNEAKSEDMIKVDGKSETLEESQEKPIPSYEESLKENLQKVSKILEKGEIEKLARECSKTWAIEQIVKDYLFKQDGRVPDNARVGMHVKILKDSISLT